MLEITKSIARLFQTDLWMSSGLAVGGALASAPSAIASEPHHCKDKPTIVVLGTGWGAISFLRALKPLHSAILTPSF